MRRAPSTTAGYRPTTGRREARASPPRRRSSGARSGGRSACGASWRQKVPRGCCSASPPCPAIVNVGVRVPHPRLPRPRTSSSSPTATTWGRSTTLLLFVALTAPDVMCPDRRNRVLPLIFARPLTGTDYVLGQGRRHLPASCSALGFVPQVVLFIGNLLVTSDGALDYVKDNAEVLWKVPVAVALQAGRTSP